MKLRLLTFILIAFIGINSVHAQTLVRPAEPNEICTDAWNNYKKADVLWNAGWILFASGIEAGLLGGSLVLWSPGVGGGIDWSIVFGLTIGAMGAGALVASVPCLAIGQVRRKATLETITDLNCAPELSCEEIKINYSKGKVLWKTGWGLFGAGAAIAITGGGLGLYYGRFHSNFKLADTGYAMIGIGSGIFVASIPCLAIGQVHRRDASTMYNLKKCSPQTPLTFTLQSSAEGLGIAMQF